MHIYKDYWDTFSSEVQHYVHKHSCSCVLSVAVACDKL